MQDQLSKAGLNVLSQPPPLIVGPLFLCSFCRFCRLDLGHRLMVMRKNPWSFFRDDISQSNFPFFLSYFLSPLQHWGWSAGPNDKKGMTHFSLRISIIHFAQLGGAQNNSMYNKDIGGQEIGLSILVCHHLSTLFPLLRKFDVLLESSQRRTSTSAKLMKLLVSVLCHPPKDETRGPCTFEVPSQLEVGLRGTVDY